MMCLPGKSYPNIIRLRLAVPAHPVPTTSEGLLRVCPHKQNYDSESRNYKPQMRENRSLVGLEDKFFGK
jgi:hypothetical protein